MDYETATVTTADADDFGTADRGKFRHPQEIGGRVWTDVERLVLAAIDADYKTRNGMRRHADLDRNFNLGPVLEGMVIDRKIREYHSGTFSAFFRSGQKPTKWWLDGDGKVAYELDEDFALRDEEAKARELTGWGHGGAGQIDDDDAEVSDALGETAGGPGKGGTRKKILDLAEVERIASEFASNDAIAKALGFFNGQVLKNRIKTDADVKAAYDRGRYKFSAANAGGRVDLATIEQNERDAKKPDPVRVEKPSESKETPSAGVGRGNPIAISEKQIEDLAAEGLSKRQISARLGYSPNSITQFDNRLRREPALRQAMERGWAMAEKSGKRPYKLGHPLKEVKPEASAENISGMDLEMVERLARDGMTAKDAAAEFGLTHANFKNRINADKRHHGRFGDVSKAWARGRAAAGKTSPSTKPHAQIEPAAVVRKSAIKPKSLRDLASTLKTQWDVAQALGISTATLKKATDGDERLAYAYQQGRKAFVKANGGKRPKGQRAKPENSQLPKMAEIAVLGPGKQVEPQAIETASPQPAGAIVMEIDEGEPNGWDRRVLRQLSRMHHKETRFARGGVLDLMFDGNVFAASADELALIGNIGELIREFEDGNGPASDNENGLRS